MPFKCFPTFFVVGAPRCGTSALSRYLKQHPQICFSRPKEPHYFSRVSTSCTHSEIQRDYLGRFFPHCNGDHKAMGEGSVSYLFFPRSIETILRFNPEAKFIAMVRNPLDMVYSYYQRLLYVAEEDQQDFAAAWALQESRAQGSNLPKRCRQPALLQYEQVGRMGHHIENLFRLAPKAKCHVIVFDDFKADTEGVYRKVLEFVGVDYKKRPHFQIKRESRQYKSRLLQTLIYNPPFQPELLLKIWLYSTRTYKRRRDGKKRFGLKKLRQRLRKWNTSHDPVIPLSEDLRSTLGETFESDIQKLGSLLGRDFSHWK